MSDIDGIIKEDEETIYTFPISSEEFETFGVGKDSDGMITCYRDGLEIEDTIPLTEEEEEIVERFIRGIE